MIEIAKRKPRKSGGSYVLALPPHWAEKYEITQDSLLTISEDEFGNLLIKRP